MVHENGLGQNFAEDHIQHGTAGKAQAQRQTQRADLTQPVTQNGTQNGGDTGGCRDKHSLPLGHTAADQRHRNGHAFGDVVQSDEHRQHQRCPAHDAVVAGIGCTDGHAFGNIVQGNGRGHHHARHKQAHLAVILFIMGMKMVAVNQFVQIVGSLGVTCVNVSHLRIGSLVDDIVQNIRHGHTEGDGTHHRPDAHTGFHSFRSQVKADHAEHHAAGKAQQQAYRPLGLLLQQRTDKTAQACAHHACQGCGEDQST